MDNNNIFNNFLIQFDLDFFVSSDLKNISKKLKLELGKNIVFPKELKSSQGIIVVGEEITPTMNTFVLSSAKMKLDNMYNLKTSFLPAGDMKILLVKLLNWIKDNGYTTKNCNFNISISLNRLYSKNFRFTEIDKLKLFLEIDEKEIYKNFPNRKDVPIIRSVKTFYPINKFILSKNMDVINVHNFSYPTPEFSAIDVSKVTDDIIIFKYLGGEDYEKNQIKFSKIFELFIQTIYNVCSEPSFTESNLIQLKKILKESKKISEAFNSVESFVYYFPKIIPMVDLKANGEVLKSFWGTIRDRLYDVIVNGGMQAGYINYDSDNSTYQIKDSVLNNAYYLSGYEIFNSKLGGIYNECDFFDCTIQNAYLLDSNLLRSNLIKKSFLMNTHIQFNNKLEECIVDNERANVNGKLNKCIILKGTPSTLAVLTDCKIVKKI